MEREREGIQEGNDISYREKLKGRQRKKWGKRRRGDWSVVALYRPINQNHLEGLGLSSYGRTYTRTRLCPILLNVLL